MCPSVRQRDERGLLPGTTDRQKMDMTAGGRINSRSSTAPTQSGGCTQFQVRIRALRFSVFQVFYSKLSL